MRRRLNKYTINTVNNSIILEESVMLEDVRLIVDETQHKIICSSMQKNNVVVEINGTKTTIPTPVNISSDGKTITIDTRVCTLVSGDAITFEIDKADKISDATSSIQGTDVTATNTKIVSDISNLSTKVGDSETTINTSISTSETNVKTAITDAQSTLIGTNTEASQTKILEAVQQAILDAAEMNKTAYASVFQKNDDSGDTYTLTLPNIFEVDETTQTVTV